MVRRCAQADLLVVNTAGYLRGPGRRLAAALIGAVQPDMLVSIGTEPGLEDVLQDHGTVPQLRLPASSRARRRSQAERRRARQAAFADHFKGAQLLALPLDRIAMEGARPGAAPPPCLLVGLADAQDRDLGLGLVEQSYPAGNFVLVRTAVPPARIRSFRWGALALDSSYRDLAQSPDGGITPPPSPPAPPPAEGS